MVGVLVGAIAGWALAGVSVSASNAVQVRAEGVDPTPNQSHRLAQTYARLLPEAPGLLRVVGTDIHRSEDYVRSHLTMSAQGTTAVVFARFSASSAAAAVAGLRATMSALSSASDTAGSKLHATVAALSEPAVSAGFSRSRAILLGGLSGALIALALALILERRRPRVDDLHDLASIVVLPVSQVSERSLLSAVAHVVQERGGPVELVMVDTRHADISARLTGLSGVSFAAASQPPSGSASLGRLTPRTLLVGRGAREANVREACLSSVAVGRPVVSALLVDPRPLWSRATGFRHGLRTA